MSAFSVQFEGNVLVSYKTTRIAVLLAISVLIIAAIAASIINAMAKQSLDEAARGAGYQSVGPVSQNSVGYGTSQYLHAQTGACAVLIYRRELKQGYWYTAYYDKESLSSDGTLPTAQEAAATIARRTGTTCVV